MAISTAVGLERISRVVGYKLTVGAPEITGANLPQRIAIITPANTANQTNLPTSGVRVSSANEGAEVIGFGSPGHSVLRILRPLSGTGVGGIPTIVYPVEDPDGAVARVDELTVTATSVTANATHTLRINGRENVDGQSYSFTVLTTDTQTTIAAKIVTAINSVVGAPVTAAVDGTNDNQVNITSKFAGSIANDITIVADDRGVAAGITYVIVEGTAGAGDHEIATALAAFGEDWNTIAINTVGENVFEALEQFNGVPDNINPTGRYSGIIFRPFWALFGSTEASRTTLAAITGAEARRSQVTNVLCPAPNSEGMPYEAAANAAFLLANTMQNQPHRDVSGQSYPDMPVPVDGGTIGDMASYENRDILAQTGCSTVNLVNGRYQIQDFVTTFRPENDPLPAFRYVRNLGIDFNVRYSYLLRELAVVVDRTIVGNDQTTSVAGVIKPKIWQQEVISLSVDLASRALIVDPEFMQTSIRVQTSGSNPDRLETSFSYRRSGFSRISSTDAEANFAQVLTA